MDAPPNGGGVLAIPPSCRVLGDKDRPPAGRASLIMLVRVCTVQCLRGAAGGASAETPNGGAPPIKIVVAKKDVCARWRARPRLPRTVLCT